MISKLFAAKKTNAQGALKRLWQKCYPQVTHIELIFHF